MAMEPVVTPVVSKFAVKRRHAKGENSRVGRDPFEAGWTKSSPSLFWSLFDAQLPSVAVTSVKLRPFSFGLCEPHPGLLGKIYFFPHYPYFLDYRFLLSHSMRDSQAYRVTTPRNNNIIYTWCWFSLGFQFFSFFLITSFRFFRSFPQH